MLFVCLVICQSELFSLNLRLNTFSFLSKILSLLNGFPSNLINVSCCVLDLAKKKKKQRRLNFISNKLLKNHSINYDIS